ncbi:MAG: MoxR family ATPase, partial [Kiritimatiellaeota bacterium]|nr:MoxR family ATPase [Kiritimatiellota bacterium]
IHPVLTLADVLALRADLEQVYCDEKVGDYLLDIVRAKRKPADYGLKLAQHIHYGGSPRAVIFLNLAARAHALLNGRAYTTPQDVKEVAPDVLRHRVLLTYEAEAEELTSDAIISTILGEIPVP